MYKNKSVDEILRDCEEDYKKYYKDLKEEKEREEKNKKKYLKYVFKNSSLINVDADELLEYKEIKRYENHFGELITIVEQENYI